VSLSTLLAEAARKWPERVAFESPGEPSITFRDLDRLADDVALSLAERGVGPGDRVGLCLPKSIDAVAALFGILRAGGAYVPAGVDLPASRVSFQFRDCDVRVALVDATIAGDVAAESTNGNRVDVIAVDGVAGGAALTRALGDPPSRSGSVDEPHGSSGSDEIAYILYTSGSTGTPKGVTIRHESALAFVEWCTTTFAPSPEDRFSSHAPFHFDLSILDLFVPVRNGATCVLIPADVGKDPLRLGVLMEESRLTFWYSTPSVLGLLCRFGRLERRDLSSLRTVLFAGEVMPVRYLREWKRLAPAADFCNLYGPTETNVCTFHRIPHVVPDDRTEPYPIGRACEHYRIRVVDEALDEVPRGEEGELVASGPGVMAGYWGRPDLDEAVFFEADGARWYRTGDLVAEDEGGDYRFLGRRDRMVKKRGFRVELDEIEVALHRYDDICDVAVVAREDEEEGVRVIAFVTTSSGASPSTIALKKFCLEHLPSYMVPDRFAGLESLPRGRTDKLDYVKLRDLAAAL
jgi:amino acid adenylation domain-containing protein